MNSLPHRELKFRAWDDVKDKMYYLGEEEDVVFTFGSAGIVATDITEGEEEFRTLHHLKYMQHTGLKDKNGVEIYEGDVLRKLHSSNVYDPVQYKDGQYICIDYPDVNLYDNLADMGLEVIGHIYDGESYE